MPPTSLASTPNRAEPVATARKKILLVDDSATTHMWIKMILNKYAYDMLSAKDGEEGVLLARAQRPDLILMDVVMPRMDGFTATRELRKRAETHHMPIIMVTTRAEAKNIETAYESGCSDYITKPIDGLELLAKIKNFLVD